MPILFYSTVMLPKKALDQFKQIYEKQFGQKLSEAEALEFATTLLNLYRAVLGNLSASEKRDGKD